MHPQTQDDSDEEGFFTQHIQVKQIHPVHSRRPSMQSKLQYYKTLFEAKYLPWTGLMKKEPEEALRMPLKFHTEIQQKSERKRNKNSQREHPYRLYATNQSYQLVYKRTKSDPIFNDRHFINNEVKLQHIGNESGTDFKKIKNFSINEHDDIKPGVLAFDSRFESGNLHCAYRFQKTHEYVLFIENDTNSLGYNQWFYFSVQNNQANVKYTFKIVNFKKKHSFFKFGLKPSVFSLKEAQTKGQGWSRRGKNVIYEQSPIYIPEYPDVKFYCLTFDLTFEHKNDYTLIAMNLPYSYTKLTTFLKETESIANEDELKTLDFSVKSVCRSICGNDVPEITITRKSEVQNKKMIIIMARQHPGQIWSSYMMEAMIRRMVSKPDEDMLWLLQNHVFKIFPMINVDGVIYGNFRCDITGVDLNRRWKDTSKIMYPQIFELKRKISAYRNKYKIQACFDLHGHSKNYNIFTYSCKINQFSCRVLPLLISHCNPVFNFSSCTFGISRYKQSTARASIYKIIRNENVLTIETSFFGSRIEGATKQFSPQDVYKMGEDILTATKQFMDKKSKKFNSVKKQIQERINEFSEYDKINEEDSGSESDPEGDEIDIQTKINNIFNKSVINVQEFTGIKNEKPANLSPKKAKDDQVLQIKSKQFKNKSKSPSVNPIVVQKEILVYQNPTPTPENTIQDGEFSIAYRQVQKIQRTGAKNKRTISYSQQKSYDFDNQTEQKAQNPLFRERKKKISMQTATHSVQPKSERRVLQPRKAPIRLRGNGQSKQQIKQIRPSEAFDDKEMQKSVQQQKKSNEFIKKFERFIPASLTFKNKSNASMFQQALYNEDQNNLISMLLENKKKIQLQKIKRNVEQSTLIAQRQGKVKLNLRPQQVIDFRAFKQNQKINRQIRKLTSIDSMRYQ